MKMRSMTPMRVAKTGYILMSVVFCVLGVLFIARPDRSLTVMGRVLGIAILADGLFKVRISMDSRAFGIGNWWMILVLAVITCGAGALLVLRPWQGAKLLARLLGASLLCEGVLNLCVAVSTVKIIDHQHPDVIEVEYT